MLRYRRWSDKNYHLWTSLFARLMKALKHNNIDEVMELQADLVKPLHVLKQVVCVKG